MSNKYNEHIDEVKRIALERNENLKFLIKIFDDDDEKSRNKFIVLRQILEVLIDESTTFHELWSSLQHQVNNSEK